MHDRQQYKLVISVESVLEFPRETADRSTPGSSKVTTWYISKREEIYTPIYYYGSIHSSTTQQDMKSNSISINEQMDKDYLA